MGCSMVSPGCAHCYAERMSARLAGMARGEESPGRKLHYLYVINDRNRWNGPIKRRMLAVTSLRFDPKNPRVYSLVGAADAEPDQQELEDALVKMDHVKQLIQAIKGNGGLTDPILVREKGLVVVEGNSRLAAYRILMKQDALKWGRVKCDVIPDEVEERLLFALLVQYHIVGRKDWDPFEQAGLFWRRSNEEGVKPSQIAGEMQDMGLSTRKVQHMIDVYQFMIDHSHAVPNRWSYYDEMFKSRDVTRAREEHPELAAVIVKKIQSGEIGKAVDVRDKVAKIAKAGGKPLVDFMAKKKSINECYERAVAKGVNNLVYGRVKKFRDMIIEPHVKEELESMPAAQVRKCVFEMKRIKTAMERLIKQFDV